MRSFEEMENIICKQCGNDYGSHYSSPHNSSSIFCHRESKRLSAIEFGTVFEEKELQIGTVGHFKEVLSNFDDDDKLFINNSQTGLCNIISKFSIEESNESNASGDIMYHPGKFVVINI